MSQSIVRKYQGLRNIQLQYEISLWAQNFSLRQGKEIAERIIDQVLTHQTRRSFIRVQIYLHIFLELKNLLGKEKRETEFSEKN